MLITGEHDLSTLPIQAGDKVVIRKGTKIYCNHTTKEKCAKITYAVTVDHVISGAPAYRWPGPRVSWIGSGGYYFSVDINDIDF